MKFLSRLFRTESKAFTVKFGKVGRTLEYKDREGSLLFAFDFGSAGAKSLCLEHHLLQDQRRFPNYTTAFERTRQFLASCGYEVEIFGDPGDSTQLTATDVTRRIRSELERWSAPIRSRIDIEACLTLPKRTAFKSHPDNKSWNLWVVLEERPATRDGWKIVFDEFNGTFGVARGDVFAGFEGGFVQTLEAISR